MRSTATAISCHELVKCFGSTRALDGLELEVRTGEVHGFLGPNGAGKTVTMRILLGLVRADAGSATLLGGDPWADAVDLHRRLAYVPGDTNLWPNLTGGEIIDLLGRLRGGLDPARRAELVDRFDLDVRKKARAYSKGNRQKVALVAALASQAELLILDEPTAGLDPLMEAVFQDCVHAAAAEGRTVLLSSHILAEVEKLCDRVTIIRKGRTVQHGSLDELRELTRTAISVELDGSGDGDGGGGRGRAVGGGGAGGSEAAGGVRGGESEAGGDGGGAGGAGGAGLAGGPVDGGIELSAMPGVHNLRRQGSRLVFEVDQHALGAVMQQLAAIGIRALDTHPPTLEELFLRQYGSELAEAGVTP